MKKAGTESATKLIIRSKLVKAATTLAFIASHSNENQRLNSIKTWILQNSHTHEAILIFERILNCLLGLTHTKTQNFQRKKNRKNIKFPCDYLAIFPPTHPRVSFYIEMAYCWRSCVCHCNNMNFCDAHPIHPFIFILQCDIIITGILFLLLQFHNHGIFSVSRPSTAHTPL